jgi:hypothetical protein
MPPTPNYDVDAPEDSTPSKAAYFSKKDWRWIVGTLLALALLGTPLYFAFQQQRDKQVCATNMKAIWEGMMQYAALHDDRLPPIYEVGENGAPLLNSAGVPIVWASQIKQYVPARVDFDCPSAEPNERMTAYAEGGNVSLTYGMYVAMGAEPHLLLAKEDDTALIVETSNNGSQGSFNPLPFRDAEGRVVPFDAFMAAYDDSNVELTPDSKWITRLAIRGVSKGYESKGSVPRHGKGIHVFYVNGTKGFLKAPNARVRNIFPDAEGPWRVR